MSTIEQERAPAPRPRRWQSQLRSVDQLKLDVWKTAARIELDSAGLRHVVTFPSSSPRGGLFLLLFTRPGFAMAAAEELAAARTLVTFAHYLSP